MSAQKRSALLVSLRLMAKKAASFNLRTISSDFLAQRKAVLRSSDIFKWARMIKRVSKIPVGFSAAWFITPEGIRRRPRDVAEALVAANQEWCKLMVEPNLKWQHPLIRQYVDKWGRPRGSMNLRVACLAPPGDPVRDIACAYMGSPESGFSIVYWSSRSEVQIQSEYSVRIRDYVISKESGLWKVISPQPRKSASGEIMSICGKRPQKWNMSRWLRWVNSCSFGALVFESGWTQWGDITGPLSPLERKLITQGSRHSRPGPSYWKIAFLPFFPP